MNANYRHLFTSESVTEGHPDKLCDQISDAVLDGVLEQDPLGRVACETVTSTGLVFLTGEITTTANLDYTKIISPIDGVVVDRQYDVGQTVAASLQAPTLFTIAQDLTKMQVYTATDESDVGMIRPGQRVTFKVDAFPKDTFMGIVSQVRMNPTTVQNVVTYNTIIDFDNPDLKLFPGMTAYVTIPVATVQAVLKVPNGALRYNPDMKSEELRALLQRNGIEVSSGRKASAAGGQAAGTASKAGAQGQGGPGRQLGQQGEQPGGGMKTGERPTDVSVVWKLGPDKKLVPVQVRTGITDHTVTEVAQVLHGDLKEGDEVVIGSTTARSGTPGMAPGMGGPRR